MSEGKTAAFFRRALAVVGLALWALAAGTCEKEPEPPKFPEYAPTKVFLAEQERNEKRAVEFWKNRARARAENLARHQLKTLDEWDPIFQRIQRELERQEADRKKRTQVKKLEEEQEREQILKRSLERGQN